jgi:hypothetical protein
LLYTKEDGGEAEYDSDKMQRRHSMVEQVEVVGLLEVRRKIHSTNTQVNPLLSPIRSWSDYIYLLENRASRVSDELIGGELVHVI